MTTVYQPNKVPANGNSFGGGENSAIDAQAIDVSAVDAVFTPRMARGLYVGGAGTVVIKNSKGDNVSFVAVGAGTFLPVICSGVVSAGTTATSINVLF